MAQKIGKYEENRPVILISVAFIYYCPAKNFVCVTKGILDSRCGNGRHCCRLEGFIGSQGRSLGKYDYKATVWKIVLCLIIEVVKVMSSRQFFIIVLPRASPSSFAPRQYSSELDIALGLSSVDSALVCTTNFR